MQRERQSGVGSVDSGRGRSSSGGGSAGGVQRACTRQVSSST